MASSLYDVDASKARIAHLKKHIAAQRQYIFDLPPFERPRAQKNLEALEEMLDISEKTDLIIERVVCDRRSNGA